jgi:hypothetical protein
MAGSVRPSLDGVRPKSVAASLPTPNLVGPTRQIEANPREKAAIVFDMALIRADVKGEWVALTLSAQGFRVSKETVSKWRNPSEPELPNYAHIVALGPDFERAYAKCVSQMNGWGRLALVDVVKAIGELAEEMSA